MPEPDIRNGRVKPPGSAACPGRLSQAAHPLISVWLRDLVISLAISAFIIIFLYQPVKVEGTSMMPSLDDQERIFVNKFVYRLEPIERGETWSCSAILATPPRVSSSG